MSTSRLTTWGFALALLLAVTACGGKSDTPDAATTGDATLTDETMPAAPALNAEQKAMVDRAVEIAKEIQANPDAAVAILEAKGLTAEQWSNMLEDIARDAALAAAYEAGMK